MSATTNVEITIVLARIWSASFSRFGIKSVHVIWPELATGLMYGHDHIILITIPLAY